MVEAWLAQATDAFWGSVGSIPTLPRNLDRVMSLGYPIALVDLPKLSVYRIEHWFQRHQIPYRLLCRDRALCGCIVAAQGHGIIFVSRDDRADEQRFTIAHEVAHYLLDYFYPRQQAHQLFGDDILPVLNGERPPSSLERVDALLGSVSLGVYLDMLPRSAQGDIDQDFVLRAEERADRLALELLAPAEDVLARVTTTNIVDLFEKTRQAASILVTLYGLPHRIAQKYATWLLRDHKPTTAQWLGLS
ncbi:ImmA/IrrE family metallo-endopeptidase [bacterium]|nr:ImmA/IrrE family metallo-endopeptidase [bacterium]